jgi:hypothetical protein
MMRLFTKYEFRSGRAIRSDDYNRGVCARKGFTHLTAKQEGKTFMNPRKEKTVITIESYRRTRVHSGHLALTAWCEKCSANSLMILPNEAAALLQITAREIFRRVEADELHFLETESEALLICVSSLLTKNQEEE